MNAKNILNAKRILAVYLAATVLLLFLGYSVQRPRVTRQEFPFTITYSVQGKTAVISDVFVGEYVPGEKYLGDDFLSWHGHVKDRNLLEADFYRVAETDDGVFSIDLNIEPGYLMGDPAYAGAVGHPTGKFHRADGLDGSVVSDPAELEKLGFFIVSWEYPEPIENRFSYGGISMSSEATLYTTVMALLALLACLILIRKDPQVVYGVAEKVSIALNFLVAFVVFPFGFMVSVLSEIVSEPSVMQQVLYLAPALTVLTIGASVFLRRSGYGKYSIPAQLVGPIVHSIPILLDVV